ncbi:Uncharacterized protein APZ42_027777 [Daphnia magna]|uniref:Uncharacterized protein n=1 Tax=Daphnia magna TaxID=35525 RepID=A0A164R395_9CRUS|nr:Uncharacterized protein APZ42_027777 [Daphnia magna]
MNQTKKNEEVTNLDWSDEILMTWIEEDTPQLEISESLPTGNDWEDVLLANLMSNEARGEIQISANASENFVATAKIENLTNKVISENNVVLPTTTNIQVSRNIRMEEVIRRYSNSDSDCEFMQKKRYSNSDSDCEVMQKKSFLPPTETEEEEKSTSKVGHYYSKIESDLDPSSSDSEIAVKCKAVSVINN